MGLAEYQLKEEANNWWVSKKANQREPVTWEQFKEMFFEHYFPSSTRDKMFSQLLTLRQGYRSVAEYEAEFNKLIWFVPEGIRDHERTKIKKFRDGLNLELQHDIKLCDFDTLGALVNKAKMMEESREKLKAQKGKIKATIGKRPFSSPGTRKFEAGSGSGSNKKQMMMKPQNQG